ncbi:hypothetical protein MM300_06270 [Evansella sp. LMS18]|uniref:hypothetical protein n=1 Tax=Evansella sp. LMS18 TaxID=2924033 RepID=UPI0020D0F448|nr:hypothetical protein [Evansella sp. LMS18]UTR11901.1 hypothetical protein MM300_06270 [Evansella sp. LMS18]
MKVHVPEVKLTKFSQKTGSFLGHLLIFFVSLVKILAVKSAKNMVESVEQKNENDPDLQSARSEKEEQSFGAGLYQRVRPPIKSRYRKPDRPE